MFIGRYAERAHILRTEDLEELTYCLTPTLLSEINLDAVSPLHLVGVGDKERNEWPGTHNTNNDDVCVKGDTTRRVQFGVEAEDDCPANDRCGGAHEHP